MIGTLYSNTSFHKESIEYTQFETSSSRKNPQSQANNAVLNKLAENIPGVSASDFSADSNEFSPEKIASRVSDFVAQGLENARKSGRSDTDIQKLYDAAVAGVKKGFEEAKEILGELDILNGSIAEDVAKTEDLTFKALDKLNPAGSSDDNPVSRPGFANRIAAAERYSESESLSLTVKTRDGDEVTINFASAQSQSASFAAASDGNGNSAAVFNLSRSEASSYQFSVKGDLDEGEIDALNELIKDVGEISNEFFDGDVQKAFEMATQFDMDTSELAAMDLTLTKTQTYAAAAAYQQVEDQSQPAGTAPSDIGNLANRLLEDFAKTTQSPALAFLENAQDFSQDLLDNLVKQDARYREADEQKQSAFDNNLANMRSLLDSLVGEPTQNS